LRAAESPSSPTPVLLNSSVEEVHVMSRTRAEVALSLFAALTLLPPGEAVAGPPVGPLGKMVLATDEAGDWLRTFRTEKDEDKRLDMLRGELVQGPDPRVAVGLGEALYDSSGAVRTRAAYVIIYNHDGLGKYLRRPPPPEVAIRAASIWWQDNKADLRRRAARIPREPSAPRPVDFRSLGQRLEP
jgi:hypothetical protein